LGKKKGADKVKIREAVKVEFLVRAESVRC
jgi:hypothetical protein